MLSNAADLVETALWIFQNASAASLRLLKK